MDENLLKQKGILTFALWKETFRKSSITMKLVKQYMNLMLQKMPKFLEEQKIETIHPRTLITITIFHHCFNFLQKKKALSISHSPRMKEKQIGHYPTSVSPTE